MSRATEVGRVPGRDGRMPVREEKVPGRDEAEPGRDERVPGRDEIAVSAFVETFAATLTAAGMQRLVARVVALMLTDEDGRMTASEIGAALHVSPAAVSGAMAFLREYGFVTTERERGTRRDVHVIHTDAWHDVTLSKTAMMGYLVDQLERGVSAVGGMPTRAGRRLAYSAEFYRFIAADMARLVAEWESRRGQLREQYLPE